MRYRSIDQPRMDHTIVTSASSPDKQVARHQSDMSGRMRRVIGPLWLITSGGVTFALIFTYLPPVFFTGSAGKYIVSGSITFGVMAIVGYIRQRRASGKKDRSLLASQTFNKVCDEIEKQLVQNLTPSVQVAHGSGWCHFLLPYEQSQEVSPLSTSFGLRTIRILQAQHENLDISGPLRTIIEKQDESGGWSAQSQQRPSPEVTASILATIRQFLGEDPVVEHGYHALEQMLNPSTKDLTWTRTYVAANVLADISSIRFNRTIKDDLLSTLVSGAIHCDTGFYWAESLTRMADAAPSTPLTALAVVAVRAAMASGVHSKPNVDHVTSGACEWLRHEADLRNQITPIVRNRAGSREVYVAHLFTSSWVVRAMLALDVGRDDPTVRAAMDAMWSHYREGMWHWDSGEYPTWMTYQGAHTAYLFARKG
jgi:hypothetical protein